MLQAAQEFEKDRAAVEETWNPLDGFRVFGPGNNLSMIPIYFDVNL